MSELLVLTPPEASHGFRLAGVRQTVLQPSELETVLRRETDGDRVGLIIVDERLLTDMPAARLRSFERHWGGVLVVLPAPGMAEVEAEDYALRVVRDALGYQMRLSL